ncbi:MAG: aspartate-semialdehyde dehydrogenase [Candidatus Borkfalkiaceae bacterium]|nr:aspartate-semialdehyde dehydrogenase [Christensenellaceae bacterium]
MKNEERKFRKEYSVAVVGATGLVGSAFLKILEESSFPVGSLRLFASEKSRGKKIPFRGEQFTVGTLGENAFSGTDVAFFSAGATVSAVAAPLAEECGALVVDNSSAFRGEEDVPLVVPEINLSDYTGRRRLIANPNCSTIQAVLPLSLLKEEYGLRSISYTTFQAVSGSGKKGLDDLTRSRKGEPCAFYPCDISETCFPQIGSFTEDGYTEEENKMKNETRKILHLPDLPVSATCVRVPVPNAHAVVVSCETEKPVTAAQAREVLARGKGVVLLDLPGSPGCPLSTLADGRDEVFVGRVRRDDSRKNGIVFYCVADNIRRGAAYNAFSIVRELCVRGLL